MAKEGAELGVELAEMWLCGRSYLPSLADAADNLFACGDALVRVANIYAATDSAAAAEMSRVTTRFVMSDEYRIDDPTVRPPLYRPE